MHLIFVKIPKSSFFGALLGLFGHFRPAGHWSLQTDGQTSGRTDTSWDTSASAGFQEHIPTV